MSNRKTKKNTDKLPTVLFSKIINLGPVARKQVIIEPNLEIRQPFRFSFEIYQRKNEG